MHIFGLTGGIGTGKSTASEYFMKKGFEIIDADQIAREIVEPKSPLLNQISDCFGSEFVVNGKLLRKELGRFVFESEERKKQLDDIMMGSIIEIIENRIYANENDKIIDAPLLFEVGLDSKCDKVFVVWVDIENRISRVMKRDGITRQEVLDRIANQMPMEEKVKRADFVLDNSNSKEELYAQVDKAIMLYV